MESTRTCCSSRGREPKVGNESKDQSRVHSPHRRTALRASGGVACQPAAQRLRRPRRGGTGDRRLHAAELTGPRPWSGWLGRRWRGLGCARRGRSARLGGWSGGWGSLAWRGLHAGCLRNGRGREPAGGRRRGRRRPSQRPSGRRRPARSRRVRLPELVALRRCAFDSARTLERRCAADRSDRHRDRPAGRSDDPYRPPTAVMPGGR
jgi:hypothetical protein